MAYAEPNWVLTRQAVSNDTKYLDGSLWGMYSNDSLLAAGPAGTTNQYGSESLPAEGETAAHHNAARMPGARYTKSFNTLTSAFQAEVADRPESERVVQWVCGDDSGAKEVVMGLIADAGYAPMDLGGTAGCEVMEMERENVHKDAKGVRIFLVPREMAAAE